MGIMNKILGAFACGAATTVGSLMVAKVAKELEDPEKRASVKESIDNIKNTLTSKKES